MTKLLQTSKGKWKATLAHLTKKLKKTFMVTLKEREISKNCFYFFTLKVKSLQIEISKKNFYALSKHKFLSTHPDQKENCSI